MGKEFELKYLASPADLQAIREKYGDFHSISMETHYYDTPDRKLGALRWTLRRRMENEKSICGLKTPGHNLVRGEWETEDSSIESGLKALCRMDVPSGFEDMIRDGVQEVCGARFTRLAKIVDTFDGTAEIALDQGVFLGGGREQPFSELEIELKSGSRQAAEQLAGEIADTFHLEELLISKFERALALSKEE